MSVKIMLMALGSGDTSRVCSSALKPQSPSAQPENTILLANAGACKMGDYRYVYEYCSCSPYRGCRYYEMYTTEQLKALRELLQDLLKKHGITYRYSNRLGDICNEALKGNEGVFLATAYSKKVSNPHPQYELLKMFKELARWVRLS